MENPEDGESRRWKRQEMKIQKMENSEDGESRKWGIQEMGNPGDGRDRSWRIQEMGIQEMENPGDARDGNPGDGESRRCRRWESRRWGIQESPTCSTGSLALRWEPLGSAGVVKGEVFLQERSSLSRLCGSASWPQMTHSSCLSGFYAA
ncbi:hypothetical protein HGM15179_020541 [Zosterops borbonicus]|uniref:Uncharacterized protein n=1 Tax=Zosterops borbonicus TaxID=364589 RepID=A0A8K1D7K4_9PASS|nr:hypothetical protein HGM15179_020541 [Zosterops borbonicus]